MSAAPDQKLTARDKAHVDALCAYLRGVDASRWFRIVKEIARRLKLGTLVP